MRITILRLALLFVVLPAAVSAQRGLSASRAPATRIAIYDSRTVFDSMP